MWYRKVDGDVYKLIISRVKDYSFNAVVEYQAHHERIIKIVKNVIDSFGEDPSKKHAYVWFAQGVWYCCQRYKDEALVRETSALYIYWRALGLNPDVLRRIASGICVELPDDETILTKYLGIKLVGMSEDIVYRGTKRALQETLHGVDVNPTETSYEYDPATGNLTRITIRDKVTGRTKVITFTYDEQGNLISKNETVL